jgi:hypothetical protein
MFNSKAEDLFNLDHFPLFDFFAALVILRLAKETR